jgi:hypothetical protein
MNIADSDNQKCSLYTNQCILNFFASLFKTVKRMIYVNQSENNLLFSCQVFNKNITESTTTSQY